MKKTIGTLFFAIIVLIATKSYATGIVNVSCDKPKVKIGEEFNISVTLTRCRDCIINCKSISRHKQN